MANNIILTPNVFCKGVLMNLGGYLSFCRNMTKEYNKEFIGKKVGDTVSVRKPQIFTATTGLLYQPQPLTNIKTNITVGDVTGVHFEWDGVEKTLSIDEAQEKYFKPAAIAMAHRINANAAQFVAQNTYNAVGTPGTTPTLVDTYLAAGDKIVELGLPPEESLTCIVNRKFSSQYVIGQKTLYNEAGTIGAMMRKGEVVDSTLGYTWKRDQTIYSQTTGPYGGTPLVDATGNVTGTVTADGGSNGTMTLSTRGWTATAASRLVVGDRFTCAGVYSVHPQTKQSTGDLLQFVVLAAFSSNGSGNGGVMVRPAITPSGQYQNVTAAPVDGAAITTFGAANTVSPQAILMHKNAYAFVSVPLENPPAGSGAISSMQTDPDTGLSLSLVQFFDGVNRIVGSRLDSLTGFGILYPELACAIAG
ncbi:P22 phage major capsid protein family protein [Nevskia soli]|uniref:P22 phage major capsid protein family protein n=1 Tax=Nevskia soli TaxID=418856 RepID=UPI00214D2B22|nr:P22 phage major capsid protein family protein [Nevskia soli]